jgi:hypothetical protein
MTAGSAIGRAFDAMLSNAVIEHVGDEDAQRRFVGEHRRVRRHWIITTLNRWFPAETHTLVPLLHWLERWRRRQDAFTRLLSRVNSLPSCPTAARSSAGPTT